MCGFTRDRLKEIPKGSKKYHDLCFKEEIFPGLTNQGYSEKLILLVSKMSTFYPIERITIDEARNYLNG